VINSVGL